MAAQMSSRGVREAARQNEYFVWKKSQSASGLSPVRSMKLPVMKWA
jgi:hypothetical protein